MHLHVTCLNIQPCYGVLPCVEILTLCMRVIIVTIFISFLFLLSANRKLYYVHSDICSANPQQYYCVIPVFRGLMS